MNLKTTLAALRSGWHLIVIGAMIAALVAVTIDRAAVPVYEASASYVVSPGNDIAPDDIARGVDTLDSSRSRSIMTTLTEITDSDSVLAEAVAAIGLDPARVDAYSVSSVVIPEANVMETTVTGPDPEVAASLASTIGEVGGLRFVALYRIYDVAALDAASAPTASSNPGLSQILVVAIAIGAMIGSAAALLRSAWLSHSRRSMSQRLDAYEPSIAQIEEHARFKRVG